MALALLLVCLQVYVVWRGCDDPWRRGFVEGATGLRILGIALLAVTLAEGVLGSQVREMTDEMARSHAGEPRSAWTEELEGQALYLAHRSFSWVLVVGTVLFIAMGRTRLAGGLGWLETLIGALVMSLMVMGLLLSQVGVLPVVQVLHVGVAIILVAAQVLWILAATRRAEARRSPA
jgi:cytochrome c oxidase assembly protein subunit 15